MMSEGKKVKGKEIPSQDEHGLFKKGYQPTQGGLGNPPQGGSGVPSNDNSQSIKEKK